MNKELKTIVEQAFTDKELARRFVEADTIENAQQIMKDAGFDLTLEQIGDIGATVSVEVEDHGNMGELTEAELEKVDGGVVIETGIILIAGAFVGICALGGWLHGRAKSTRRCSH